MVIHVEVEPRRSEWKGRTERIEPRGLKSMSVSPAAAERFLNASILEDIAAEHRLALLEVLQERRAEAGTVLVEQGKVNDCIWYLLEGEVSIQRSYPGRGIELVVNLPASTVFGESSFFRGSPPIVSAIAKSPVWVLTLDRASHARLRRDSIAAAEAFALASVRVLAEQFDLLDRRVSDYLAEHPDGPAKSNEWARFRDRLFVEQGL